jgi:hypothetical protein
MRKQPVLIAIFLAFSLILMNVSTAWALPDRPSSFWGDSILVDGVPVSAGTIISAWINGVQYAQTATYMDTGVLYYGIMAVPGDDPDMPGKQGGQSGDTVVFKIGSLVATQTAPWVSGTNVHLNLTANTPTAITILSFTARSQAFGIQLAWQTASEIDLLSFNLYRSETADGPRARLNPEQIQAKIPGSPTGAEYTFMDNPTPGKLYYYWLEGLTTSDTWMESPLLAGYHNIFMPVVVK